MTRQDDLDAYVAMCARNIPVWGRLRELCTYRTIRPFTKDELEVLKRIAYGCKAKECYMNSQRIVLFDDEARFVYVEGWVWTVDLAIPVDHAWIEYNGAVAELTIRDKRDGDFKGDQMKMLRKINRRLPPLQPRPGDAYWGMPILKSRISDGWLKTRCANQLIFDVALGK